MKVIIIGAGGHARVIADALVSRNEFGDNNEVVGFLDDDENLHDREQLGVRIIGRISELKKFEHDAVVIGIGDNIVRWKLFLDLKKCGEKIITVIHPRAIIAPNVVVGDGTVIFAGVVINSGAHIGSNVILNTACTVGHDLIVSSHAQIGPGVNLGGGVTVGEGAFVGIGSAVIQYKTIGNWAVVGAGAAVIHDVAPYETVVGVPAIPLRKKDQKEKSGAQYLKKPTSNGSCELIQSDDVKKWSNIVMASCQYDFYHTLEYHLIAEEMEEGKPILFAYQDSNNMLAIPLLLRSICHEKWFPDGHKDLFDVTSVYGYTGPISSSNDLPYEFIKNFSLSLFSSLRELHVVSLFSRLHPLVDYKSSFDDYFNRITIGGTVSIDLSIPPEDQISKYSDNHKRGMKKLRKEEFHCYEDVELHYLDDFINIYIETMDRVNADALYYFPKKYFFSLFKNLHKTMHLFVCIKNGELASAGIFSLCHNIIQYHLGATRSSYLKYSPMKLLFDIVRQWGVNNHATVFHLGGGLGSSKDSLLHFKAGFSDRMHKFAVWEKILLPEEYKLLCNAKADYNRKNNLRNSNASFFPLYRSTVEVVSL